MIDFRYHIVSLVAVFLALALGLFLGSTTLQSTVTHSLQGQAKRVTSQNHTLEGERDQANSERDSALAFTAAVAPYAVHGRLLGASVALVAAPGVDEGIRASYASTLADAGATITTNVQLAASYLDPAQDAELSQLAKQLAGSKSLPKANASVQASSLLAKVLVARPGKHSPSARRIETVLTTLTAAKMVDVSGKLPGRPADLAVLLVPAPSSNADAAEVSLQAADLVALVKDLRTSSTGAVVAGPTMPTQSSRDVLAAMRADSTIVRTVSTVDGYETSAGHVATVIALAASSSGTVGAFGPDQSPPLPSPSPAP